jgi:hypothetical protein
MDPRGFRQYVAICARVGRKPENLVAKFAARYRFAHQIQSIEILKLSVQSRKAYVGVLRLSLAYSAYEVIADLRSLRGSASLKSSDLAEVFRSSRLGKFRTFLMQSKQAESLQRQLEKLGSSTRDSNVLPVVVATRHLMFHGLLNPTAAGLTSKTALKFVDDLACALFQEMDRLMDDYLTEFKMEIQARD